MLHNMRTLIQSMSCRMILEAVSIATILSPSSTIHFQGCSMSWQTVNVLHIIIIMFVVAVSIVVKFFISPTIKSLQSMESTLARAIHHHINVANVFAKRIERSQPSNWPSTLRQLSYARLLLPAPCDYGDSIKSNIKISLATFEFALFLSPVCAPTVNGRSVGMRKKKRFSERKFSSLFRCFGNEWIFGFLRLQFSTFPLSCMKSTQSIFVRHKILGL